jgi:hypothetical protein
MPARDFLRNNWPAITIAVTAAVIACTALVMLGNMPPHLIVMATGPEGGTYHEIGERYRAVLARANVEVRLVPTVGSVDNLNLLLDPFGPQIACKFQRRQPPWSEFPNHDRPSCRFLLQGFQWAKSPTRQVLNKESTLYRFYTRPKNSLDHHGTLQSPDWDWEHQNACLGYQSEDLCTAGDRDRKPIFLEQQPVTHSRFLPATAGFLISANELL